MYQNCLKNVVFIHSFIKLIYKLLLYILRRFKLIRNTISICVTSICIIVRIGSVYWFICLRQFCVLLGFLAWAITCTLTIFLIILKKYLKKFHLCRCNVQAQSAHQPDTEPNSQLQTPSPDVQVINIFLCQPSTHHPPLQQPRHQSTAPLNLIHQFIQYQHVR